MESHAIPYRAATEHALRGWVLQAQADHPRSHYNGHQMRA
jgi:hypothetical protein